MRRSHHSPLIVFGLIASSFFFSPLPSLAAEVRCDCLAPEETDTTCLTIDASKLQNPNDCSTLPGNAKLESGWACEKDPLTESQFRSVSDGGVCVKGPVSALSLVGEAIAPGNKKTSDASESSSAPLMNELNTNIPGFVFPDKASDLLSSYILSLYRYGISISAITATILFIYGAFLYLLGTAISSIRSGKQIMIDAIIGMLLVFSAALIARTLNPEILSPKSLDITQISTVNAFTDLDKERARAEASARMSGLIEVPVIDVATGEKTSVASAGAGRSGEIVKDSSGNLVAQGNCPVDMQPIVHSNEYVPVQKGGTAQVGNPPSFCMDRYEAPNQKGVKPFIGVTEFEAEWYCQQSGKRLCSRDEWVRACLGPKGENIYGYGPTFIEGSYKNTARSYDHWGSGDAVTKTSNPPAPCNYDTPAKYGLDWSKMFSLFTTNPEESTLNPNNPRIGSRSFDYQFAEMKKMVNKLDGTEPSGSREACVTSEGVYDMSGNAAEIVMKGEYADLTLDQRIELGIKDQKGDGPRPYAWIGFFWTPSYHKASWAAKPTCLEVLSYHDTGWRSYENGFRCCMDLAD